jgi:hypothetical protein
MAGAVAELGSLSLAQFMQRLNKQDSLQLSDDQVQSAVRVRCRAARGAGLLRSACDRAAVCVARCLRSNGSTAPPSSCTSTARYTHTHRRPSLRPLAELCG